MGKKAKVLLCDIHSHILPAVDDGAQNIKESLALISSMKEQGITSVIATPHFYANSCPNPALHKKEMEGALCTLLAHDPAITEIYLGHEVHYFKGISRSTEISQLKMGDSDYLLLELPYDLASLSVVDEIGDLALNIGVTPILAHIERYAFSPVFPALLNIIESEYAIAHINCDSLLTDKKSVKFALSLIKNGYISFLASDAHSVDRRPVRMSQSLNVVKEKLGEAAAIKLRENSIALSRACGVKNESF